MTDTDSGGKTGGKVLVPIAEVAACLKTAAAPVSLAVRLDLSSSGWKDLLSTIAAAGKEVNLDLSACMTGTVFDPDYTNPTGKDKILSLTLPDTATGIKGDDDPFSAPRIVAFAGFTALTAVSGKNIQTIGVAVFRGCTALTTVSFPQAAAIGEAAFYDCCKLSTVILPKAAVIGEAAFYGCAALAAVDLPQAAAAGNGAFIQCAALATVNLPQAAVIGDGAFVQCAALSTVKLGASLSKIKPGALAGCINLRAITVDGANPHYRSEGGMLLKKDGKTLVADPTAEPAETQPFATALADSDFVCCTALTTVDLSAAAAIGGYAFAYCDALTTVNLSAAAAIGGYAFAYCEALTAVNLSAAAAIGDGAFYRCTALTTVKLGAAPPALGSGVFYGTYFNAGAALTIRVPQGAIGAYTAAGWTSAEAGEDPARYGRDHRRIVIEEYTP
jgi:hypothetical protein